MTIPPPHIQQRRKWYGLSRWKKLRARVLAGNPRCAVCGIARATAVDHIEHTTDNARFWDVTNLRPSCHPCNSSLSATLTNAARRRRATARGGRDEAKGGGISTTHGAKERDTPPEKVDNIAPIFQRLKESKNAKPIDE